MISKKEALIIGVLAIGGVAAASAIAESSGGDDMTPRSGGILGSAPTTYSFPSDGFTGFPAPIDYSDILKDFSAPMSMPEAGVRGTQGVSSAGKKVPIYSSEGYSRKGREDLPSIIAHLPAHELPGYTKPKQKVYGTLREEEETKGFFEWLTSTSIWNPFKSKAKTTTKKEVIHEETETKLEITPKALSSSSSIAKRKGTGITAGYKDGEYTGLALTMSQDILARRASSKRGYGQGYSNIPGMIGSADSPLKYALATGDITYLPKAQHSTFHEQFNAAKKEVIK